MQTFYALVEKVAKTDANILITGENGTGKEVVRPYASSYNLKKTTEKAFETIHSTAKGLSSFVESYRKFTAIPQPVLNPFPVRELITQVINLHASSLAGKNIQIQTISPDDMILNIDKNLIIQVLVNVVKNALEAVNENGEIRISVTRQHTGKTVIDISNTGQPIPKDILPFIFIPFFTTKTDGSGIGLSVSRYIMRLHNGNLIHALSPEKNTVFSLIFPG
jgi:signal transduction histidine kinase